MELLMIRHSSTRGNLLRQYVGSQDHPLAPEGVALAERRRGEMPPIDGLWVSPMLRCRQTAEILFPGVEQRLVDALKECDFGTFEGKTWAELKDDPIYQAWLAGTPTSPFPEERCWGSTSPAAAGGWPMWWSRPVPWACPGPGFWPMAGP